MPDWLQSPPYRPRPEKEDVMRIGLVWERKSDFPYLDGDPEELNSELLSVFEEGDVVAGLQDAGHEVVRIGDARRLLARIGYWRNRCDLVFNLSVGYRGIERKIFAPAILEVAGIPYVGSTPYTLALTRHKYHAKLVVASVGVATPPAVLYSSPRSSGLDALTYPVIVKPVAESSGIGIDAGSVVSSATEARDRCERIVERYRQPALAESFVSGVEIEVPLIIDASPQALGAVAITLDGVPVSEDRFLTGALVYDDTYGFADPPPQVDTRRAILAAEESARILGIRDYGRVDFRVAPDATPWFIEASSHPHIQRHSSFFFLARRRGLAFSAMLQEILAIAAKRRMHI